MIAKGRNNPQKGEERPNHKLTRDKVIDIRKAYASGGVFMRELGAKYGVSAKTIQSVIKFRKWKHVKDHTTSIRQHSGFLPGLQASSRDT